MMESKSTKYSMLMIHMMSAKLKEMIKRRSIRKKRAYRAEI